MSEPAFFSEGSQPLRTDTRWRILMKILGATLDGGAGGGVGPGTNVGYSYRGSGDPEGVVTGNATPPDKYWDETNLIEYIKNTGEGTNTGWQAT